MKNSARDKILSILGLTLIVVFIGALIVVSNLKPPINESVWQSAMTTGDTESPKRHYIMYTDIMCPYCDVFTRATMNYADEFNNYLAENDILFEVRMTNMLYYSGVEFSTIAAEGAYCAAGEEHFWDYYHGAIQKLWDDYHSKGIGDSKTSPAITGMDDDWWLAIGETAGLSADWTKCVQEAKTATAMDEATAKAMQTTNGLPYFNWDGTIFNGLPSYFETWEELKEFLDMGL